MSAGAEIIENAHVNGKISARCMLKSKRLDVSLVCVRIHIM